MTKIKNKTKNKQTYLWLECIWPMRRTFIFNLNFPSWLVIYFKLCLTGDIVIKTTLNSIRNKADSSRQTLSILRPEDINLWFFKKKKIEVSITFFFWRSCFHGKTKQKQFFLIMGYVKVLFSWLNLFLFCFFKRLS